MILTPEQFTGNDTERIQQALNAATKNDIVQITGEHQQRWMLDEALLLHSDLHMEIRDCTLKLSNQCRDNFMRSNNCGIGMTKHPLISNLKILGYGNAVLEGADVPRATGDGAKILFTENSPAHPEWPYSYGSDAEKPDQYPKGDWRNIGILLCNLDDFEISGLTLREYHAWGISMERCSNGRLANITLDAHDPVLINGIPQHVKNRDGIDLRFGCHHIEICNITGESGDDIIALTALPKFGPRPPHSTEVSTIPPGADVDIHDVRIHDIFGHTQHQFIRLLCAAPSRIYNVDIYNCIAHENTRRAILLGDTNYGGNKGEVSNISLRNLTSSAYQSCIELVSVCRNIIIENVTNKCQSVPLIKIAPSADVSGLTTRDNK